MLSYSPRCMVIDFFLLSGIGMSWQGCLTHFFNPTVEQIDGRSSVSEVIHSDLFCWVIAGSCFRAFFFLMSNFSLVGYFQTDCIGLEWHGCWVDLQPCACFLPPFLLKFLPLMLTVQPGPGAVRGGQGSFSWCGIYFNPPWPCRADSTDSLSPVTCQYWQDPTVWIPRKNVIRNHMNSRKEWWSWKSYVAGRTSLKSWKCVLLKLISSG